MHPITVIYKAVIQAPIYFSLLEEGGTDYEQNEGQRVDREPGSCCHLENNS